MSIVYPEAVQADSYKFGPRPLEIDGVEYPVASLVFKDAASTSTALAANMGSAFEVLQTLGTGVKADIRNAATAFYRNPNIPEDTITEVLTGAVQQYPEYFTDVYGIAQTITPEECAEILTQIAESAGHLAVWQSR